MLYVPRHSTKRLVACARGARRYRELAKRVKPYVADTVKYINDAHKAGKTILVEGANATMLDINFGTYPYVTSSSPSIGGVIAGMGLAHNKFQVRCCAHASPRLSAGLVFFLLESMKSSVHALRQNRQMVLTTDCQTDCRLSTKENACQCLASKHSSLFFTWMSSGSLLTDGA